MRKALSLAVVFSLAGPAACAAASDRAVSLECVTEGQAAVALCQAMRGELHRRGYAVDPQGTALVLNARSLRPDRLRADLTVVRDGRQQQGQTGDVSVVDRRTIPQRQLETFAAALLDKAGLSP